MNSRAQPPCGKDRKLVSVTWPLVLTMSLMLLLSVASISVLSSVRAYVNGEGLWSKAERQAIAELRKYSVSHEEVDFRRFQGQLAVPLGDRVARLELLRATPDTALAGGGLLAGHNDAADIPGMIRLFRLFHSSSLMAEAVRIWTEGDAMILQLAQAGEQLHAETLAGHVDAGQVATLLAAAERVHRQVAPLEDGFSNALGVASRKLASILLAFLAVCSAVLVAAGSAISRANVKRGETLAQELRASEELVYLEQERAHVTLSSISDAVISAGSDGRITYMNGAAEHLTGWSHEEAQERDLGEVLSIATNSGPGSVAQQLARIIAGESISGAAAGVVLRRRDGTEVPVHERAAPLRARNGEVIGIVLVLRDNTQEQAFAARLEYQATHDALTGLANRAEFEARLAAAIEAQRADGGHCSLVYLDLDQFKVINDTCGHAAGDELIKQVGWLIRSEFRTGDVVARLGGDEFGALLQGCSLSDALVLAESMRRRIAELRFRWLEKMFVVNASMGVVALGETLPSVSEALSAADQACYLAKDNGRNRVQPYRPDDQQVQTRHGEMRWVERLNSALADGSFVLLAQEIRPVKAGGGADGRLQRRRFEVLLRMIAPDGQSIAPMAFIPAAERYGLMPSVDRWVITRACRELANLRARGVALPTCMVNLSGASVSNPSLADYISGCLEENSLPAHCLGIELTETAAIGNLGSAAQLISRLRALGCPIALDDFGSGMSSFSYLKTLPIDFLKIDGGFVRLINADPINFAVVEAIQRVGSLMGIQTVAECVEDEATLQALARIGVDFAQGYHIQRPMPLTQIEAADSAVSATATGTFARNART
jgi:diguanylate cyclase (GGDEF)-like protein/PAS domain S-box-containing protein